MQREWDSFLKWPGHHSASKLGTLVIRWKFTSRNSGAFDREKISSLTDLRYSTKELGGTMKSFLAFGMKDSIFGVFYIMNEASTKSDHGSSGVWQRRWCILSYFLDSGQVFQTKIRFWTTWFKGLSFIYSAGHAIITQQQVNFSRVYSC